MLIAETDDIASPTIEEYPEDEQCAFYTANLSSWLMWSAQGGPILEDGSPVRLELKVTQWITN